MAAFTGIQEPTICQIGYRLHMDMFANLKFVRDALPLSEFIAAAQELRLRFQAAEVTHYPWATAPGSNAARKPR
jgi:hypothetical protein